MKAMRAVVATCAVLAAMSSVAQADLVLVGGTPTASFTDLGAQGFGNDPRLLTLQTNTFENGSVIRFMFGLTRLAAIVMSFAVSSPRNREPSNELDRSSNGLDDPRLFPLKISVTVTRE